MHTCGAANQLACKVWGQHGPGKEPACIQQIWRAGEELPPAIASGTACSELCRAGSPRGRAPRWALPWLCSAGTYQQQHNSPSSPDPMAGPEFWGTRKVVLLSGPHFAGQVFPSQKKRKRITFQNSFPSLWREKPEVEPSSCYYAWFKEIRSSSKREGSRFIVSTLKIAV